MESGKCAKAQRPKLERSDADWSASLKTVSVSRQTGIFPPVAGMFLFSYCDKQNSFIVFLYWNVLSDQFLRGFRRSSRTFLCGFTDSSLRTITRYAFLATFLNMMYRFALPVAKREGWLAQSGVGHFLGLALPLASPTALPRRSNSCAEILSLSMIASLTRSLRAVAVLATALCFFLKSLL